MTKLVERMDMLAKENKELRAELNSVKQQVGSISIAKPGAEKVEAGKQVAEVAPVTGKNPISIYGFVKADAIWNNSPLGAFAASVPAQGNKYDDQFILNTKDTRLGLDIQGPEVIGGGKTVGKLEMDFWGGTATALGTTTIDGSTSPLFRMRQAYIDLVYKNWDILAGQAWDFFSPLNPTMLNIDALWRQGNLGERHPQITGTRKWNEVLGGTVTTKLGALQTDDLQLSSAMPVFAEYIQYDTTYRGIPITLGSGALFGRQVATTTDTRRVDAWGVTAIFKVKPLASVTLMGEGYVGSALSGFRAGSTTGATSTTATAKGVRAHGGWVQALWKPITKLELGAGLGTDQCLTDGTGTTTIWNYNSSYFTNMKYELGKNLYVGLEYQWFLTKFTQQKGGEANRVMSSLIYNF